MLASRNAVVARIGVMAQVGTRAVERGLVCQWQRQVCVRMASTALIFSALHPPVRLALHLPVKHQVGPGRVARGNHSSLLRQCSFSEASDGATATVLLETRECADGSIMYRFGTPDQKYSASALADPNFREDDGQIQAQLTTETREETGVHPQSSELPGDAYTADQQVVIVNGLQHTRSPPVAVAKEQERELNEPITDLSRNLASLGLRGLSSDSAGTNGVAGAETLAKDLDPAESGEIGGEAGKDETGKDESPAHFNSGAAMIPHPKKAARGGEDAFFIEGTRWIGVADGVGGWAEDGINAGDYARELMWHCAELARQSEKDFEPKTLLRKGFSKTKALGSTTAVVASIANQTLNVVNMGDSGFLVIRDGIPIERSKPMLRGFNFPFQMGSEGDDPSMAEVYRVPVKTGDVIVLATDGVFDNLFEEEIVNIVNSVVQTRAGPEVVAKKLASEAHKAGARIIGVSPFSKEAQRVGYIYVGGKMDDITTVVSFVS